MMANAHVSDQEALCLFPDHRISLYQILQRMYAWNSMKSRWIRRDEKTDQMPSICLPVSCCDICLAIPLLRSYTYSWTGTAIYTQTSLLVRLESVTLRRVIANTWCDTDTCHRPDGDAPHHRWYGRKVCFKKSSQNDVSKKWSDNLKYSGLFLYYRTRFLTAMISSIKVLGPTGRVTSYRT